MTFSSKQDALSAPNDAPHIPALDGLRALAILLVIPHNSDYFTNSSGFLFPITALVHAGWIGVQLFFVLSGFLITRNLLQTRHCTNYLGAFYGRRVLRIFPLYFLALFVGLVLLPQFLALSAETLASQRNQFWLWVFLSNWVQPFNKGVIGFSHFWSLAVEEQFYLVWPFVVLAATATRLRWISVGLICAAITVRCLCVRAGLVPEIPYQFTVCRMDALAVGAIAAGLAASNQWSAWLSTRRNFALFVACSILLGTALSSHLFNAFEDTTLIFGQTTLAIGFGLVLLSAVETWRAGQRWWLNDLLELRPLRSVGKYSYAMYVVHLPIALGLGALLKDWLAADDRLNPILFSTMVLVASYASGWLSYHCFEKYFLKLKPRYKSSTRLHV